MKFSKKFEKDFKWYSRWKGIFNFDANANYTNKSGDDLIVPSVKGKTAKECFYIFDSTGQIEPCREPDLLKEILRTKGSINFNIKMWAEDRGKAMLGKLEFDKIAEEFELLPWMIEAVEMQRMKYWRTAC